MQIFKAGCLQGGVGTHLFCGWSPANINTYARQQHPTPLFKQNARHLLRLVARPAHHKVIGPLKPHLPAFLRQRPGQQHAHSGRCRSAVKRGAQRQAQGRIQIAHGRMPLASELAASGCLAVHLHAVPRFKPTPGGQVCSCIQARTYLTETPDTRNKIFVSSSGSASLGLVAVAYYGHGTLPRWRRGARPLAWAQAHRI